MLQDIVHDSVGQGRGQRVWAVCFVSMLVGLFASLSARLGSIRVIVWFLIAAFCYLLQGRL
jgi:hypothetical protein